jgi:hypothetical protein
VAKLSEILSIDARSPTVCIAALEASGALTRHRNSRRADEVFE